MSNNGKSESQTVEVIGAGWGRTGTATLKKALQILGYNPCFDMIELLQEDHSEFWTRAFQGKAPDFDEVFNNGKVKYTATCDFPAALFWKEQLSRYPNAKVILTVRDGNKWYDSAVDTIFTGTPVCNDWFGLSAVKCIGMLPEKLAELLFEALFHGDWSKENMIRKYNEHNDRVKKECPKEKLLILKVTDGWKPLCDFLNKPIPSVPFPHENEKPVLQQFLSSIGRFGVVFILIVAIVIGLLFNHLKNN